MNLGILPFLPQRNIYAKEPGKSIFRMVLHSNIHGQQNSDTIRQIQLRKARIQRPLCHKYIGSHIIPY